MPDTIVILFIKSIAVSFCVTNIEYILTNSKIS